jgi:hypothetical protein
MDTHDEDKIIAERADFALGKRYLRELIELMTIDFLDRGGRIQHLRPCFAVGCEIRPAVRQAIRRGQ